MDTNSTSQKQKENVGRIGCEACIKKDELISDMYEVVKWVTGMASHTGRDSTVILMAIKALAKAEGGN